MQAELQHGQDLILHLQEEFSPNHVLEDSRQIDRLVQESGGFLDLFGCKSDIWNAPGDGIGLMYTVYRQLIHKPPL